MQTTERRFWNIMMRRAVISRFAMIAICLVAAMIGGCEGLRIDGYEDEPVMLIENDQEVELRVLWVWGSGIPILAIPSGRSSLLVDEIPPDDSRTLRSMMRIMPPWRNLNKLESVSILLCLEYREQWRPRDLTYWVLSANPLVLARAPNPREARSFPLIRAEDLNKEADWLYVCEGEWPSQTTLDQIELNERDGFIREAMRMRIEPLGPGWTLGRLLEEQPWRN